MKNKYSRPEFCICEAQGIEMLAQSLYKYDDIIDGTQTLTKEYGAWNIWDEEV